MQKKMYFVLGILVLLGLALQSCGAIPVAPTQAVVPPTQTEVPVVATTEPSAETVTAPVNSPEPTTIQHLVQPDNPVYIDTQYVRDCELGFNYVPGQPSMPASSCDMWDIDFVERPVSSDFMSYYSYLDILEAQFGGNKDWIFGRMVLVDTTLPAEHGNYYYMIEFDLDLDNVSDVLVVAENLRVTDVLWTVNNLRAYRFENGNVVTIFDQGVGEDPDALWVRRPAVDLATTIEFAFKPSFLGGDTSFAWWFWTYEGDSFDPALYIPLDLMPDSYMIDNTCAMGFNGQAVDLLNVCRDFLRP